MSLCEHGGIRTPNLLGRNEVHYPVMLRVRWSLKDAANIGLLEAFMQVLGLLFLNIFYRFLLKASRLEI